MNYLLIIIFIIGFVFGGFLVWVLGRLQEHSGKKVVSKQTKTPERHKKILNLFKSQDKVTNNDVEALLGVSDATATNYLQEMEEADLIRQVGKTGRGVFYQLNG